MKRLILFLSFCVAFLSMFADSWVRINQLGYIPKTSKVAVYLSEEATEVSSFQLEMCLPAKWFTLLRQ